MIGETALLLHRAVRGWLVLYSGIPEARILPARHNDQHRPNASFITIRVRGKSGRIDVADEQILHADGSLEIRGGRVATVQLTGYGAEAVEAIDDIEVSRARPDVIDWLRSTGVVVDTITTALEENATYEGQWEPRTFRELTLTYLESRTYAAGTHGAVIAEAAKVDTTIADFDDSDDTGIVAESRVPNGAHSLAHSEAFD